MARRPLLPWLSLSLVFGALALARGASAQAPREGDPEGDREVAAAKAPAEDEPLRRVKSVRDIEVRARDLRLRDSSMTRLESIAARYHRATGQRLVVTGGGRTPKRQARLMVEKLANGDDIIALYADKAAATEIRDVYLAGVARRDKKPALERQVLEVIDAQIARGTYISRHLQGRAADVRSRGMTPEQETALREAVAAEPGAALLDERDGEAPHWHLNL